MKPTSSSLFVAAAVVLAAVSCTPKDPIQEKAYLTFDAYPGAECPDESRGILARNLGVVSDQVRIVYYGPAGNDLYYFAALGRNGAARAGTFDEAQARVVRTDYQTEFKGEDWPWAVKGLVNEPPFSDRQVRWGPALMVKVERRPKSLIIHYIDGWLPAGNTWSTGKFETNLAGNQIWFEEHTPATAETAASAGTAAKPPTAVPSEK